MSATKTSLASRKIIRTLRQRISVSCRSPRDRLETRLLNHLKTSQLNPCLLATPPTSRLATFSCVRVNSQNAREFICFRQVDDRAVRKYQDDYDPEQAFNYKTAAAACPVTNHDASEAPNSLFP